MSKKQKYAIPAKAVRLLRRVIKHILAEPNRYDQTTFLVHDSESPCGTAGCIAGWAVVLDRSPRPSRALLDGLRINFNDGDYSISGAMRVRDIGGRAIRLIGRKAITAHLFTGLPEDDWPQPFAKRWDMAGRRTRARIAADRIEHFIRTGK